MQGLIPSDDAIALRLDLVRGTDIVLCDILQRPD